MTTLLENEKVHPRCDCHQCTWLRANQVDRAFMPKEEPQRPPSGCEHRHELGGCHKILGCPPNTWDGDKTSPTPPEPKERCSCDCHRHDKIDTPCFKCYGNFHTLKAKKEPEPKCQLDHGACYECRKCLVCGKCECKPEPRGEFGAEVEKKIKEFLKKPYEGFNAVSRENDLRSLLRLALRKGE